MNAQIQALPFGVEALNGLSAKLINSHHQHNHGGAVKRLNAIREQLAGIDFAAAPGFLLNGLKHEELIATNSMLLHELYFDSLGSDGSSMEPACALALSANFGSVERWREEFTACAKALGGGSGWMLLVFQAREGRLVNQWAADHTHALAGGVPILALDMYEHAYHLDFGANAGAYVDAFMSHIHWTAVYARYQHAVSSASHALGMSAQAMKDAMGEAMAQASGEARAQAMGDAMLIDVRRAAVFEKASTQIRAATWRDPAELDTWVRTMPKDKPVIAYCVYGHEVSRAVALRLRAAGLQAHFLQGGIDAWQTQGLPTQPKSNH
jgi:Fe-Mn family superoxide dismutase